jgi:hypothetical protein
MQQTNMFNEKPLEAQVQKACLEFLSWKGIFHWRNNSGGVAASYTDKQGNSKSRWLSYGKVGSSDLLAIYPGGRMWLIEVKRPGGRLSDSQISFLARARQRGAIVTIAESVDDLTRALASPDAANHPRYEAALGSWKQDSGAKFQA